MQDEHTQTINFTAPMPAAKQQKEENKEDHPVLYTPIRMLFTLAVQFFYNTVSVANFDNFPQHGPTILAFNHGNGLVDAAILMSTTAPRVLRFCAKDSLWELPFWGWFVRNSGAVPVYRPKDHSKEKAAEYNEATFVKCYEALHKGECLGIAPEGVSRFAPNLAQPLKTGPVRIAMRALELHPDMPAVQICPVGITYTHREKFRSSVLVDFGKPIMVTREHVADGSEQAFHSTARMLTEELNSKLIHELTIHSPSFAYSKLAMTATRMQLPFGTKLSLQEYFAEIRFWLTVLPENSPLSEALAEYQTLLDLKRVKDERVRRYAIDFELKRPSSSPRVLLILYRAALFAVLSAVSLPGVVLWSPVWFMIRRWERALLAKGAGWNDSVTEMKMQVGALIAFAVLVIFRLRSWKVFAFAVLQVRAFEEALACGRSLLSHYKFYFLYKETLAELLRLRRVAKTEMLKHRTFSPAAQEDKETAIRLWPWENWSVLRRRKKDWNETLRLHDFNTMDYFE